MHEQENDRRLSRRRFIGGSAALGLGSAFLAACGDDSSSGGDAGSSSEGEEGSAPSGSGSGVAGSGDIPPVKIGFVTPRSGVLAAFGEADAFVLASLRDALGANVEILDRDAESDPAKAGEVAQELISEGIDIMLAGGTPDISVPVAAACDLSETVCLTTQAPWQPHYLGTGGALGPDQEPPVASEFNYHIFWGLEDVIEVFLGLWDQSGAAKVVGALWASDPDGNAWSDPAVGFPPAMEAAGYELLDPGRFDLSTQDYSAIISQFKDAGVQIVSGVVPPPVFATYQAQALQQDFNPPVVTVGKALLFPSAAETFPKGAGLSTEIWWTDRHPYTSSLTGQTAADLAQSWEDETGTQWIQPLGFSHMVVEVAIDALKRAGSTDKSALLTAIGETKLDTIAGPIDFSAGPVPHYAKTPLVGGQWVEGADWPLELAINVNDQLPDVATDGEIQPIA
jgi:branched-chain amino acid transport system substrate-binding protein